jgi:hypothetical protein
VREKALTGLAFALFLNQELGFAPKFEEKAREQSLIHIARQTGMTHKNIATSGAGGPRHNWTLTSYLA